VERAAILATSPTLTTRDLSLFGPSETPRNGSVSRPSLGDPIALEEIEREHIARVVAQAESFEAAARALGIDTSTLQRKRKRYGLA
jgi:NtrC-family two-component system response regulator AlgB